MGQATEDLAQIRVSLRETHTQIANRAAEDDGSMGLADTLNANFDALWAAIEMLAAAIDDVSGETTSG